MFLIPKQLTANGLRPGEITISEEAIRLIISQFTREAGVRNLEREIASVMRRDVADMAVSKRSKKVVDDVKRVRAALGKRRFYDDVAERIRPPRGGTGLGGSAARGRCYFRGGRVAQGQREM